jgi:RsiW-degrading membrane proteinase PrsW (M82 family)
MSMAFTGPQPSASAASSGWVFNPPPGWSVPSPGWQPPAGWRPDPAWPPAPEGWEFWRPATMVAQSGSNAYPGTSELYLTFEGRRYTFVPGQTARIGREAGNDIVVSDPMVSRKHAQLRWVNDGWVFENVGQAFTFLGEQPVAVVALVQTTELALGSPQGPVVRVEPTTSVRPSGAGPIPQPPTAAPAPPGGRPPRSQLSRSELAEAVRILVPVGSWLTNPGWRQGLRLLVVTYALLPLVFIALFASSNDLKTPGWVYSLYVAPLWAIGFWLLIRPGPITAREIRLGIWIIVWTFIYLNVVTININDALAKSGKPLSFPTAILVGYNEELTKALPIMIAGFYLLIRRSIKLDVRMWMFLGTIAGLTFGVAEAALYTSQDILIINQAQVASQAVGAVLAFAERVFVDGFQHAVWAGISGFFIGMALEYRRRAWLLITLGVSIPAILHALNDWSAGAFNSYWPWITIQAVSLFLFLGYTMSSTSIEHEVRRTPIFRGESIMMEAFWRREQDGR